MRIISDDDFSQILNLVIKELPKNNIVFDRVYEGVIAYHASKLLIELNFDDFEFIKEEAKKIIENKIEESHKFDKNNL